MTVLSTLADLPIESPLTGIERNGVFDAATRVALGEITGRTLLHVRGAENGSVKVGDVSATPNGLLVQLRRDEFVLLTQDGQAALNQWNEEIKDIKRRTESDLFLPVTFTDITHGRSTMLLVGKQSARVLAKVCGLDFSDAQFPNLHAAQTSLAKVRTLIIRADIDDATPSYALIVDRSLAAYVWGIVFDAMQEFGGVALSEDGLKTLRTATLW
ncbi:MAG TPA: hypothetical protein VHD90_17065 [Phototrophicaceae bacterium]|nr:hypothetical protein [Phototrophicaceae bacterium]